MNWLNECSYSANVFSNKVYNVINNARVKALEKIAKKRGSRSLSPSHDWFNSDSKMASPPRREADAAMAGTNEYFRTAVEVYVSDVSTICIDANERRLYSFLIGCRKSY